jgi:hypothetical protein
LGGDPCFVGSISFDGTGADVAFYLPQYGMGLRLCDSTSNQQLSSAAEASAQASLQNVNLTCLPGSTFESIEINGVAVSDVEEMNQILQAACPELFWSYDGVAIFLDAGGKVVSIGSEAPGGPPIPQDIVSCIMKALEGLAFPCLGGYAVCPEYVIAE